MPTEKAGKGEVGRFKH